MLTKLMKTYKYRYIYPEIHTRRNIMINRCCNKLMPEFYEFLIKIGVKKNNYTKTMVSIMD